MSEQEPTYILEQFEVGDVAVRCVRCQEYILLSQEMGAECQCGRTWMLDVTVLMKEAEGE